VICASCKSSEERELDTAYRALGRGQYRDALEIYAEIVLDAPGTPEAARAVYGLGIIHYLKQRDLDAARANFKKVLDEYPTSDVALDARRMLARVYEKEEGAYQKAIKEYSRLLELTHDTETEKSTLLDVANCYYQLDNLDLAATFYQRVIDDYPYDDVSDVAYLRLALIEAFAGRVEEAEQIVEDLLGWSDRPQSRFRAFLFAGEIALQSSDYQGGRTFLARADLEFPGDPQLLDLAGRMDRQEVDGRSLDEGDRDELFLLEEMQRNISWGRGRRAGGRRR
jgi:TolA-binding protein